MSYKVAVVGATGLVGGKILEVLEKRDFPIGDLKLLASKRSEGKKIRFKGEDLIVEETKEESFTNVNIALFASAEAGSGTFGWPAVERGAIVIDNSSKFRMDPRVPLVVPEVNSDALREHQGLIANPNCSTIQMVQVLAPIHKFARIKRIVVSTYQSVSGWGREAMEELKRQTEDVIYNKEPYVNRNILPYQIAFNLIPQIDKFDSSGYTKEELKMINETQKILGDNTIKITATCVRVPILVGHSEAVNIETEKRLTVDEIREILKKQENLIVLDEPENLKYPMPILAEGRFETYVGRIREDKSVNSGYEMFIVSDNLLKGAALNAVQIAEKMIEMKLI